MDIPPLVLHDDLTAALSILKAIAAKEEALAAYASAEAKKIEQIVKVLEKTGYAADPAIEGSAASSDALTSLEITQLLQNNLKSCLDYLLEHYQLTSLRNITPQSELCTCSIRAIGNGNTQKGTDTWFPGAAHLQVNVALEQGRPTRTCIKYKVNCGRNNLNFEAVSDGLEIYWVDFGKGTGSGKQPHIALIIGQGIAKLSKDNDVKRKLATFALTIWDCGRKGKEDKFRMVIYSPSCSGFVHDSGIVTNR